MQNFNFQRQQAVKLIAHHVSQLGGLQNPITSPPVQSGVPNNVFTLHTPITSPMEHNISDNGTPAPAKSVISKIGSALHPFGLFGVKRTLPR